ncbi:MAG: anti-sigma factor, partial [Chloroflexota bacterium]|nr:anti-sigma factor [Chloroflexota bacterium]
MHQQVTDLIPPYHDGELSAVQRMQVELHLRTCATCREQLAQLKALSALLTATPVEVEATEEFWERLAPRLPAPRPVTSSTPTCVGQRPRQPWLFLPPLGL